MVPRALKSHAGGTKAARKKAVAGGTEEARPPLVAFVEQRAAVVSYGELLSPSAPRGTGEAALAAVRRARGHLDARRDWRGLAGGAEHLLHLVRYLGLLALGHRSRNVRSKIGDDGEGFAASPAPAPTRATHRLDAAAQ